LARVAFESHALGHSKCRDDPTFDLLPVPSGAITSEPACFSRLVKVSREFVVLAGLELVHRETFIEEIPAAFSLLCGRPLLGSGVRLEHVVYDLSVVLCPDLVNGTRLSSTFVEISKLTPLDRLIPDVRNIRSARPASPLRWAPESRPESFCASSTFQVGKE
jgi:hypothetical protein